MARAARLVIAVLVTCVVAAGGLGLTYEVTKDRIEQQARELEERSLREVLPAGDTFERIEDQAVLDAAQDAAGTVPVYAIYEATSADGTFAGWGIKLGPRGYGGPIEMVLGVASDGTVEGVTIISHKETPGLGTKVLSEEWFLEQFVSLPGGFAESDVKKLDTIQGATKSSGGVRKGVIAGGSVYAEVLSGTEGGGS